MILFNIKVTSGAANGFIFYCQVVSTLVVSSYRKEKYLPSQLNILMEVYLFIYRSFNMEFFVHNRLSFCLWKGATTLDIIAFTYVTIFLCFSSGHAHGGILEVLHLLLGFFSTEINKLCYSRSFYISHNVLCSLHKGIISNINIIKSYGSNAGIHQTKKSIL